MRSVEGPSGEGGTRERPIIIEESPLKKAASNDGRHALPPILRCKKKLIVHKSTNYGVSNPIPVSPPLKPLKVEMRDSNSSSSSSDEEGTESSEEDLSILPEFHHDDERIP
ncbi:Hypothetical predicted protein, partial [Paramuricea clavata]